MCEERDESNEHECQFPVDDLYPPAALGSIASPPSVFKRTVNDRALPVRPYDKYVRDYYRARLRKKEAPLKKIQRAADKSPLVITPAAVVPCVVRPSSVRSALTSEVGKAFMVRVAVGSYRFMDAEK